MRETRLNRKSRKLERVKHSRCKQPDGPFVKIS